VHYKRPAYSGCKVRDQVFMSEDTGNDDADVHQYYQNLQPVATLLARDRDRYVFSSAKITDVECVLSQHITIFC